MNKKPLKSGAKFRFTHKIENREKYFYQTNREHFRRLTVFVYHAPCSR